MGKSNMKTLEKGWEGGRRSSKGIEQGELNYHSTTRGQNLESLGYIPQNPIVSQRGSIPLFLELYAVPCQ